MIYSPVKLPPFEGNNTADTYKTLLPQLNYLTNTSNLIPPTKNIIMRFASFATALTTLSAASARIIGIEAPSTLAPNSTFNLTLLTENYIQSVADISVAWGYSLAPGYPTTLGAFTQSSYLGPNKSNTLENITIQATVPAALDSDVYNGSLILSAGVYSLYGASSGPVVTGFNVTVHVGEETSEETVKSNGTAWTINSQS